eukprot:TRINITY_DN19017_c0_g1_i1.p1 TRINITY_DN19017_c0_g1~~TRINITY_DN19017_c0_g1_i1.p1  ORF type:complete len:655 (+),score=125.61 TRINITY_DN19017_c0_g1_i1:152-2116(+)
MVVIFKDQKYQKLRKHHQDLGVPWTDHTFPANESSIGLQKSRELGRIDWRRAVDISNRPRLVTNGVGRHDVVQGKLGNCWFVAASSVLAGVPKLWERVIPDAKDQEWDPDAPDKYSGVFRFLFWRFGNWLEVLVDDLIPTRDGVPVFTYSKDRDEFWGALLEKAYAKIHGSYEALDGGNLSDALVDFTGGVSELVSLENDGGLKLFEEEENKTELYNRIFQEVSEHALVCCAIRARKGEEQQKTEYGLVKGHAYGVTAVKKVPIGDTGLVAFFKGREKVPLVRLRNPWGEKEWNGAFSDGSVEWRSITSKEKEKLGLVTEDDGEFWMPWDDFVIQFTDVSINHLINTSLFSFSKTWKEYVRVSAWTRPDRAGGCLNHPTTFLDNPQYRFDINSKEDEEIIVQLSQMDDGNNVLIKDKLKLVIGFHLLKVESNREYRLHKRIPGSDCGSSDYIRSRHVFLRKTLSPGRYFIIPTTFDPGQDANFLLRLFSDKSSDLSPVMLDEPKDPCCLGCGCGSRPQVVTRVTVLSASGLQKQDVIGQADPYVYIKCEGYKGKSGIVKSCLDPKWDFSVLFYRKKPEKPIKIQVWNSNLMVDQFMGQCVVDAKERSDPDNPFGDEAARVERTLDLYNKGSKKDDKMAGSIKILIETHKDLTAL